MKTDKKLLFLLPLALSAGATAKENQPNENQPDGKRKLNIVYIMSDDHSYQTISAYDNRYIETPNIDRIAAEGVRFTNSFVANSISGPSRACMLTGKFSHKNGMISHATRFDSSQVTFPVLLREQGYQTAIFGKWHLKSDPVGFDRWEVLVGQGQYFKPIFITPKGRVTYDGYATNVITDLSLNWLEKERDTTKPFCLIIHHKSPHRNWMPDTSELNLFEDVKFPIPDTFYDDYEGRPAAAGQEMSIAGDEMDYAFDLKMNDSTINTRLKENLTFALRRLTPRQRELWDSTYKKLLREFLATRPTGKELAEWKFQRYMRDYLKCIRSVDNNVGRVMDYLREHGLLENTLVVYTSDQGFYMGEHGWFDKRFMYEESFRTPLIMRLPDSFGKLSKRGTIPQFVQNVDYAPTFLDLAGVKIPSDVQGESIVPLLEGKAPASWRKSVYYHYFEYPAEHSVRRHYGVRDSRYKLIRFYGHDIVRYELYDLQEDPAELRNIYENPAYKSVRERMLRELERLMKKYDDKPSI